MTPPRPKRVDTNQREIVSALRAVGCSVQLLHEAGRGVPDILVGFRRTNHLLEIKSEHGKLNPRQCEWHESWRGTVCVVTTPDEALKAVGVKK